MNSDNTAQVIVDALRPGERSVLQRLAEKNGSEVIRLRALERFGFSGAKLFEAFFTQNKTGIPFVVKVHKNEKIKAEVKAFSDVMHFFEDCLILQSLPPAYTNKYGAVAYKKFTSGKSIIELKDVINNSKTSNSDLAKIVRQVYKNCCNKAHSAAEKKSIVFREEYSRYFRDHIARPRIKQALGTQSSETKCTVLNTKITNPLLVLEKGFRRDIDCKVGPIHGDLHTSNVILDKNKTPHLIDFSWAQRYGHILKDYVLLENSWRFMLSPKYISTVDQLKVDRALLREKGYENIKEIELSNPSTRKFFQRLFQSIGSIRVAAKKYTHNNFNEYLAAQFLVLYGLLAYDDYNFFSALRALGLIGGKLLSSEYVTTL